MSSVKSGSEARQELHSCDMASLIAHQLLGLVSIRLPQRRKTAKAKRLQQMWRVQGHTESNILLLLAKLVEMD